MALSMTVIAMLSFSACGNAGTKNDKNKQKKEVQTEVKSNVQELTTEQFKDLVYDFTKEELEYLGNKPAIVDFNATWCGPCKRISPILDELSKEYEGQVNIYKIDVDKCPEIAQAFGISSIPAILYIPTDKEPSMTIGFRDKSKFKNEIDSILLGK